jgi:hypothetical protein
MSSQLAIPTALATNNYSVIQEIASVSGQTLAVGTINFKGRIFFSAGLHFIISNDSDFVNQKQLKSLDQVLSWKQARDVSNIRLLHIDNKRVCRGFAVPLQLNVEQEDGTIKSVEGRKVLHWDDLENPLRAVQPAEWYLEYVWVTAVLVKDATGKLFIQAAFAPCNERTRPKDYVVEKPKPLSLQPAADIKEPTAAKK